LLNLSQPDDPLPPPKFSRDPADEGRSSAGSGKDVRKDSMLESWASSTKQVRKISPKTTEAWNRRQPAIRVRVR